MSNVLYFPGQEELTRAQAAKLFVDYADIMNFDLGGSGYKDVDSDDWYRNEVTTLYNLGLLDSDDEDFSPEEVMTRGELLQWVMDYYHIDLALNDGEPHFQDVDATHYLYPYVEGFFATAKTSALTERFRPHAPVTRSFLKYLTNEYRESN